MFTNKASFKQWSRRYKSAAGVKNELFKVLLGWAEAREANAPTTVPEASKVAEATRLDQYLSTSLIMITEAGTETHSIVDNTPRERT